jgi:hypothetical protein
VGKLGITVRMKMGERMLQSSETPDGKKDTAFWSKRKLMALAGALALATPQEVADADQDYVEITTEVVPENERVRVYESETGEKLYIHVDKEVEETFAFLGGRGEVTEQRVAALMHQHLFFAARSSGEDITDPEVRNQLFAIDTYEEMIAARIKYAESPYFRSGYEQSGLSKEEYAKQMVDKFWKEETERFEQIDPRMYEFIWNLYLEAGAPDMELVDEFSELNMTRIEKPVSNARYDFDWEEMKGRIYIDKFASANRQLNQLLQELAHVRLNLQDPEGTKARLAVQQEFMGDTEALSEEEYKRRESEIYKDVRFNEGYTHRVIVPRLYNEVIELNPSFEDFIDRLNPSWRLHLEEYSIE